MRKLSFTHACAACLAIVWLAGCAASESGFVAVRGQLELRERVALPSGSFAIVELARPEDGRVLAEQRIELDGRPVPVAFDLRVFRAALESGKTYVLRGALSTSGRVAWVTEPAGVVAAAGPIDVGTLLLRPDRPVAFSAWLVCGTRGATVAVVRRRDWDVTQLAVGNDRFEVLQTETASGARYEAIGDASTHVWLKGDRASLTVRGEAYPPCAVASESAALRARGNEPGWSLDLGPSMRFVSGDLAIEGKTPPGRIGEGSRHHAGSVAGRKVDIVLTGRVCRDTMTGMPHPLVVEVSVDGRSFRGCGGEPAALLRGVEWVVEDIDAELVLRSPPTLAFDGEGRLAGRVSCNAYTASYTLTGETLTIGNIATTGKDCPAPALEQEKGFLEALAGVRRFDVTDSGALVLHTDRGGRLTALRNR